MAKAKSSTVAKAAPPGPPQPPGGPFGTSQWLSGDQNAKAYGEVGVSGLRIASGVTFEEYLVELRGPNRFKIYRQMSESDPIVCAVLQAITLILRAVDWRVEPADDSSEAEAEAEFVESLLDDMSHPFADVIGEALSMLTFGWSYHEIVLKVRKGPDAADASLRSKYNDGRIGIRKLPIRSQDSLLRWEMQDDGGILGMWQMPPIGAQLLFIPIERALLFRTTSKKNNPEGVSVLRAAYRPWYLLKTIEDIEAIGIERELAGLPVVSIPNSLLSATDSASKAAVTTWKQAARDLKFNQQGGLVMPSDRWQNPDGTYSANALYEVKLLSTGGRRSIDTSQIIERHQRNIARSALADFMMLGDTRGSFALSKNKTELFFRACEAYLTQIAEVFNRFLLPRIWSYNNINQDLMPELKPGRLAPVDLAEVGAYIQQLAGAGAPLFPNQDLSEYLAEVADLPAPPEDAGVSLPGSGDPGDSVSGGVNDERTSGQVDPEGLSTEGFAPYVSPSGVQKRAVNRAVKKRARRKA